VTDVYGSTVAKRRLSRRLIELRTASGYTANQVCDMLTWGRGKVGRFEANVWKRPEMSDIRDLLRVYQVADADRQELEGLAVKARERTWWREYGDVFGDHEYPGYEADAVRVCVYMPLILPGMLQTTAYIEAQMRVGTQSLSWRKRARDARLRRQEILARDDGTAPDVVAVITEASLMYRWGTHSERREQVAHLVEMSNALLVLLTIVNLALSLREVHVWTKRFPHAEWALPLIAEAQGKGVLLAFDADEWSAVFRHSRLRALCVDNGDVVIELDDPGVARAAHSLVEAAVGDGGRIYLTPTFKVTETHGVPAFLDAIEARYGTPMPALGGAYFVIDPTRSK
jgi:hypothetical protein